MIKTMESTDTVLVVYVQRASVHVQGESIHVQGASVHVRIRGVYTCTYVCGELLQGIISDMQYTYISVQRASVHVQIIDTSLYVGVVSIDGRPTYTITSELLIQTLQ